MGTISSVKLLGTLSLLLASLFDPTVSKIEDIITGPIFWPELDRSYFPKSFFFGTATSAYQTEGEANQKGRGPSIWDTFTHEFPERIADGSNGDVATDFYNHYQDDIKRINNDMGMNAFRFSISWSRIIPSGRVKEGVNEEGIKFYNKVINEAIHNGDDWPYLLFLGLEPFVTLFHWDLPQALEDKYGGFLSLNIVSDYKDYAELCFKRFGDRVKHWITMNEPHIFTTFGYDEGIMAPGRCSSWVNRACQAGDSATEPYIVAHHILLSHSAAVEVYKKLDLHGKIGITLDVTWPIPYTNSVADREAAQRVLDFTYGWFMDPITYGEYPRTMQNLVTRDRLPKFTAEQSRLLKGSYDFIGLNYYRAKYASAPANATIDPHPNHIRYMTDSHVNSTRYGIFAEGIRYLLNYTKDAYKNPLIYITETGLSDDESVFPEDALHDDWRINFFRTHLQNVHSSMCDYKVNVKGLFAWSLMDNFEWSSGYTVRYGLYAVNRKKRLERLPKRSVAWFKKFLKNKALNIGPKCYVPYKSDDSSLEDLQEL